MTIILNAIYRFNVILVKLPMAFFTELEQKNFTIHMETQKTPNRQSSIEKEWSWINQPSLLQIMLQSYSHQDSMVQAQKGFCLQCRRPGFNPWIGKIPGEGNGNLLQYSCLEDPMDRGAWQATVHGITKSRTQLSDFTITSIIKNKVPVCAWVYLWVLCLVPLVCISVF